VDQFNQAILDESVRFCERFGLADSKFGKLSPINDTHLMERLRAGTVRRSSILKLRPYMQRYALDNS
jgi:hypothetical protein